MWTINDFPAYENLFGWVTHGYKACPVCNMDITSESLRFVSWKLVEPCQETMYGGEVQKSLMEKWKGDQNQGTSQVMTCCLNWIVSILSQWVKILTTKRETER